jgi:iron complex transport system ATP-binding protein
MDRTYHPPFRAHAGRTGSQGSFAGLLKLECGEILLHNRNLATLKRSAIASIIGYIPQDHAYGFAYSVFDMALKGRAPHLGMFASPSKQDYAIAAECFDIIEIEHLRDKRFTEISGGEKPMVLIARVLAQKPQIMLLDEPTSHLDFRNQTLILRMISKLASEGLSIIMTSHVPNHAITYASHVSLMNHGRLVVMGHPEDVITEKNLREIYGIDVRVFEVNDPATGDLFKFCEPLR